MTNLKISVAKIRNQFPSLTRTDGAHTLAYFDGPGGSQVPLSVIEAIGNYYKNSNSNVHGFFATSVETDSLIDTARQKIATFLGAESKNTISFGQNMTTLNYSLSKAIARTLQPGDEILITQLDHESNRAPWLALRDEGIDVIEVNLLKDGTLDYHDFEAKITENTRLVAMGLASNAFGTVNDIKWARKMSYEVGALLLLDAVHYVPHFPVDVQEIGCDFLFCSAYKFYGPHVGIMYSKAGILDRLPTDCLRTQEQVAPYKIETGTLNHAALAGVSAAVDFIESLGKGDSPRTRITNAMQNLLEYEHVLGKMLYDGLLGMEGVKVVGRDFSAYDRTPTVAFTIEGISPKGVCKFLAQTGICAWAGHFYAIKSIEALGLFEKGGVTRLGLSVYNTQEEVERVLNQVRVLISKPK